MATTTNYGWTTPDDTALVKDGASAIRSLGSSVDTTVKALNPETTLGDIAYRSSTANTKTRLGIGTTGQILTVSGGVPAWADAPSGGSMTSIASGSLSTGTLTLNSISGSYKDLYLIVRDVFVSSATSLNVRLNNDTGSNYILTGTQTITTGGTNYLIGSKDTKMEISNTSLAAADNNNVARLEIYDYANTTSGKLVRAQTSFTSSANGFVTTELNGGYIPTTAITRIDLYITTGNFSGGTYILYGVN